MLSDFIIIILFVVVGGGFSHHLFQAEGIKNWVLSIRHFATFHIEIVLANFGTYSEKNIYKELMQVLIKQACGYESF